ncbi:MAG: universal stress protein [Acidobacteria bacterium]|nr:universal stress protein [Acidobacteriota bacterium]MBW4044586.1 universal stress protein [Acidobacteriota bacterium]
MDTASTQLQETSPALHLGTAPLHIKGILAATDFSSQATLAVKIAARLAKQLESKFYVLHTILPQLYAPGVGVVSPVLYELDTKQAQEELRKYAGKIPEVRTLRHEEVVLVGPPAEAMLDLVQTRSIDLAVVGSQGRTGLQKLVLGSNAEAVIRHLHCPILVVGPRCVRRYGPLHSIVFATDLPFGSLRAAQHAMSIAQATGSSITLVHVLPKSSSKEEDYELEMTRATEQLHQLVPNDPQIASHVRFEVLVGDRSERILESAKRHKAGLIVMGVREHGVLADHAPWATLSEVIRKAHCPVLAVRPHLV